MIRLEITVDVAAGTFSGCGCWGHVGAVIARETAGSDIAINRIEGTHISRLGMTTGTVE